jgi:uncharacterized protein YjdB
MTMMTMSRFALLATLLGLVGACGGRSTLGGSARGWDAAHEAEADDEVSGLDGAVADSAVADDVLANPDAPDANADVLSDGGDAPAADRPTDTAKDAPRDGAVDVPPTLLGLDVTPASLTLIAGIPYSGLVIIAAYSDGSRADVTAKATLASSDSAIVQVAGTKLTGMKAGTATVKASFSGKSAAVAVTVSSAALQSISVDGPLTVVVGQLVPTGATGIFADGTKQDLTALATWSSSSTAVATVSLDAATGKARIAGVSAGSTSVAAAYQGVTGTVAVTVTASASIAINLTPVQPILQKGVVQLFRATATFADGSVADVTSQATWSSDNSAVASVATDASGILVRAVSAGSATISAKVGAKVGSTTVRVTAPTLVSIALAPSTWETPVGGVRQFTATGTYSDNTTADVTIAAIWSVGNNGIASVSNAPGQQGKATALAAGLTVIQATLAGVTNTASITVTSSPLVSITIKPDLVNLVLGLSASLVATGTYQNGASQDLTGQAAWSTSSASIASVSNASGGAGRITGVAEGTAVVYATVAGVTGKAQVIVSKATLTGITVTPASVTVTAGVKQQFVATGSYDNGAKPDLTSQVTWTSSNMVVAQVSNATGSNGLATSLSTGNVTITATLGTVSGSASMIVNPPLLASIMVEPSSATVAVGGTRTFTVTGIYQNGTTGQVGATWTSSNTGIASLDTPVNGRRTSATGVSAGTVTISARYQGYIDTASLVVQAAPILVGLVITPAKPSSILVGATAQFQANAIYDNGSTTNVTGAASWTTSDAKVASVRSGGGPGGRGLVTGVGAGTTTIQATYQKLSATVSIQVRNPKSTGLVVTPSSASLRVSQAQQFVAVVTYDDGTAQTVTNAASWTTSNPAVASVTSGGGPGGGGGRGLATGLAAGTVSVTASYGGFSDSADLTVTDPPLSFVQVTPPSPNIPVGANLQLVATAVFSDNTTRNVTALATWKSSSPAIAVVMNSGAVMGRVSGVAAGSATITATWQSMSGTSNVTVAESIRSITVTPASASTVVGLPVTFSATAILSNDATLPISSVASWASSDPLVATVAASGVATPVKAGSATVTATYLGTSGSTPLTVSSATLSSIAITPNPVSIGVGGSQRLVATGRYGDASTYDLTGVVTWLSSDSSVAVVSNAAGSRGLVTPIKSGSTTVTAVLQGITSAADTITVTP